MRYLITGLCGAAALFAFLSIGILFTVTPTRDDVLLAVGSTVLTLVLFGLRHVWLIRFGRLGLLKPAINWKAMSRKMHKRAILTSTAGHIITLRQQYQATKATGVAPDTVHMLVYNEMQKIKALGYDRKMRSQDELISENKLLRFVEAGREKRSEPPLDELRGVRDTDVFWELRKKVDDWYAMRQARRDAYAKWKESVGGEGRGELVKDGWIPFLENLKGPDIFLWHGIATDFHEMSHDRFEAAIWILEQPEADRATASDFILNFIEYKLPDPSTTTAELQHFGEVVQRYNQGFYRFQSIKPETGLTSFLGTRQLEDVMAAEVEKAVTRLDERDRDNRIRAQVLRSLPRPVGLLELQVDPKDGLARHVESGYAFWDDAGLHLVYPGDKWRESA